MRIADLLPLTPLSGHMLPKLCCINVDATSSRRIDINKTSYLHHAPAGYSLNLCLSIMTQNIWNTLIQNSTVCSGARVAERVKRLPADLMVQSLILSILGGKNLFSCEPGSIAHSLSLSPFHCPGMTEILLKKR